MQCGSTSIPAPATMRAWQLSGLGGAFELVRRPVPVPRAGGVVVRMQASALMSYMRDYVEGKLTSVYRVPAQPFVPGANGVGIVEAVGEGVWHLRPGQRVVISSHLVAQENVREPGQMLLGVTAPGEAARRMQHDWPDGTMADFASLPASVVTPADGLDHLDATQLVMTTRHIVPYGGLLRGRLAPGETVVVSGATGAYGSAAVFLALALGASRVVALGRDRVRLAAVCEAAGPRAEPLVMQGDAIADAARVREMLSGGADLAFDMVGGAADSTSTLTALRCLADGGRLVLMGSMSVPLPLPYLEVMLHGWEILGQFMYPRDAYRRLLDLVRSGQLDVAQIRPLAFPLDQARAAMAAAHDAHGLECVVLRHGED